MIPYNWDVEQKNAIRKELMKRCTKKKPANVALFLPAHSCLCVKEALNAGLIDQWTQIIAIERKADVAKEMEENLQKLGITNYTIIRKELVKVKLEELLQHGKIDFAYLDTCCHLSPIMQEWIDKVYSQSVHGMTVSAFTFINSDRNQWYNNEETRELQAVFKSREILEAIDNDKELMPELPRYQFSQIPETELLCKELVSTVQKIMPLNVTYGRAYKNGREQKGMITFSLSRRQAKQRKTSGKKSTYDLGFVCNM